MRKTQTTADSDAKYMSMALCLARRGKGRVEPNPMVGCVIVKDGTVVGRGFHEYFGGPHAEVNALREAGRRTRGATLYVTLEPCRHWGKTPPCTGAIVRAGIRRVVAAMGDPNPRIAGRGFRELGKQGIDVAVGILEDRAAALNRRYLRSLATMKSHVIVKAAMSLDGKIAAATGDSKWITGPGARNYAHRLRSRVDAIVIGARTVLCDDPALTSHGAGKNPVRVIIDPSLTLPLKSRILDKSAPTVVVFSAGADRKKYDELKKRGVILLRLPLRRGRMDFKHIVRELARLSVHTLLIEGGGTTIASALEDRVVDEVLFFVAPKIIGGKEAPTPVEGKGIRRVAGALRVRHLSAVTVGNDILIKGTIKR